MDDAERVKQESARLAALQAQVVTSIQNEAAVAISFSWLRKRFNTNYATAVHLMDRLEMAGVIGSAERGREVLMPGGVSIFD